MSIGWVHFSSDHRKRVQMVIDLLNKGGIVDELGVGIVRDSFADTMFPGISTIQTRAKYFTLIAHLLKDFIEKHKAGKKILSLDNYLDNIERDCRITMIQNSESEANRDGIIGITFGENRNKDIVRKPSSIYWNGLRIFGFLNTLQSISEFSRNFQNKKVTIEKLLTETSLNKGDDKDAEYSLPLIRAPKLPKTYMDTLTIDLLPAEAQFLRSQIESNVPGSLIGKILLNAEATDQLLKLAGNSFSDFSRLPFLDKLNDDSLQKTVTLARKFWEILYGAHIRYNCLLQKKHGTSTKYDEFQLLWNKWVNELPHYLKNWDTDFLFIMIEKTNRTVYKQTENFIRGWINEVKRPSINIEVCDELIIKQEINNKGGKRARLAQGNINRVDEWIGLTELNYRLPQVRTIVSDIISAERQVTNA